MLWTARVAATIANGTLASVAVHFDPRRQVDFWVPARRSAAQRPAGADRRVRDRHDRHRQPAGTLCVTYADPEFDTVVTPSRLASSHRLDCARHCVRYRGFEIGPGRSLGCEAAAHVADDFGDLPVGSEPLNSSRPIAMGYPFW
jgi:hypothetical protein